MESNQIRPNSYTMFMATIPFDEISSGASVRLAMLDDLQYLSARDVLMHICSTSNKQASQIWERLSEEKKKELAPHLRSFQFPGKGQSEQPVLDFKGVLKLVMLVSGDKAALYRTAMVKILSRYYAGDDSLTDEIEANAQSASPIAQMARASLAAEQPVQELSLDFKRKREELEMCRMEAEIETMRADVEVKRKAIRAADLANMAAERDLIAKVTANYNEVCQDTVIDERARLIFKDSFLNIAMLQGPAAGPALLMDGQVNNKPVSLSMIAAEMGMKIPSNELISIGVELKKRYVAKHGKDPSKHDQLCNGRMTKVNSYTESDRPLIEEVLRWHAAGK